MTDFPANLHLLLVEDDPIVGDVGAAVLKRFGIGVDRAMDGREALMLLRERRYDLVLMDCELPFKNGLEVTQEYRLLERQRRESAASWRPTPIIALSAHAMPEDREIFLAAGMDDCLEKPIDIEALRAKLRQWLNLPVDASPVEGGAGAR
ncbi:MAG: response regulator, partial [Magnetococcales bacterium]|nr:response regulator [Magnetococcales bacterium]